MCVCVCVCVIFLTKCNDCFDGKLIVRMRACLRVCMCLSVSFMWLCVCVCVCVCVSWCFEPSYQQRITSEHKLHSISKLIISQVIIPQVVVFEPIYIPRAVNTGTSIQQGDLFYSAGLLRNHVLATANTGKIGRGFGKKMQVNGPEG